MNTTLSIAVGIGALVLGSQARADDSYQTTSYQDTATKAEPGAYSYAWSEPRMSSNIGVGVVLGGGVSGFTDSAARDVVKNSVGGLWDLRVSIGTHIPIGIDISYLGTASSLERLGVDNGTLIGTTLEAAVRYNILPHFDWNPYVFAGVGWQRYDVRDQPVLSKLASMGDSDSFAEFPLGLGMSYRGRSGLVADVRGTVRVAADSSPLLRSQPLADDQNLHTWEASAAIGYEF